MDSKNSQGLPSDNEDLEAGADSITAPSQGADVKEPPKGSIFPIIKFPQRKKSTDNKVTSYSQQSTPNNQNSDKSKKVDGEVTPSQVADVKEPSKGGIFSMPKFPHRKKSKENISEKASGDSQGLSSNENQKPSQGADDKRLSRSNVISHETVGDLEKDTGNETTSDSQQSSPNIENANESRKDEVPPSQSTDGKTTITPKEPRDLGNTTEEESHSSKISERNNSENASKGCQGLLSDDKNLGRADSITASSKGAGGEKLSFGSFFSTVTLFQKKSTGNKATRDSQKSSPDNENPYEARKVEVTPSQGADGETTSKPKDLGTPEEEESQSSRISEGNNSERASEGSQGLPSGNENPKPKADGTMSPSKGAAAKKSSTSSLFQNPFKKKSTGNEAASDSQQSSANSEHPVESKKLDDDDPSQGAAGKSTSKAKDLGILTEEESQSSRISEGSNSERASKGSQGLPSGDENPKPKAGGAMSPSKGAGGKKSSTSSLFQNPFKKKSTGSNEGSSHSHRSSSNNENLDESKKVDDEVTPSQGAAGKKTFKPKDLGLDTGEAKQSWIIFEGDGPAELLEACWLDVTGSMPVIKGKTYEINFKLSMNEEESFGWEDPVSVMAKIGEDGEYESAEINLSQLGKDEKVFPLEKFRIECKSEESTANKETLYFGLYEVWTNKWKGGLRIHEAIVQELTAAESDSTSNTHPEESEVPEVTADNSTSTSNNPTDKSISDHATAPPGESIVPDSASTSNEHLDDFASASCKEELGEEPSISIAK